jgi:hypothetical protein
MFHDRTRQHARRTTALAVAAALAVTPAACAHRDVPDHLAGYPRTMVERGAFALREVRRLHTGPLELRDAAFAVYGAGAASVWMAEARDTAMAMRFVADMRTRIGHGDTPFSVDTTATLDGREVVVLSGMGQRHWCFRSGRRVVWIAAHRRIADTAREEAIAFYR